MKAGCSKEAAFRRGFLGLIGCKREQSGLRGVSGKARGSGGSLESEGSGIINFSGALVPESFDSFLLLVFSVAYAGK